MTKQFAVHGGSDIFVIVRAEDEAGALDVFVQGLAAEEDEYLWDEIHSFTVNASLMEKFYRDEVGYFLDENVGEIRADIEDLPNLNEYIQSWIEKNVREFFCNETHLADEYLAELQVSYETEEFYTPTFSSELVLYAMKAIILGGKWFNDFKIVEVDAAAPFQMIYRD